LFGAGVTAPLQEHIDSILWIRGGKGRKDRRTLLPPKLLVLLRIYWRWKHPKNSARAIASRGGEPTLKNP
jgi:integrase